MSRLPGMCRGCVAHVFEVSHLCRACRLGVALVRGHS